MPLQEQCLWETLTPQRPQAPGFKGELNADVCVIGAGITGLSAAIHLLEQGKSVCVLEAHRTGHGGSGRNVGLVNAGMWIAPDDIDSDAWRGYMRRQTNTVNYSLELPLAQGITFD